MFCLSAPHGRLWSKKGVACLHDHAFVINFTSDAEGMALKLHEAKPKILIMSIKLSLFKNCKLIPRETHKSCHIV